MPPDPSGFAGQGEAAKKGAAGMDRISGPMNSLGAAVREGAAAAGYKPAQVSVTTADVHDISPSPHCLADLVRSARRSYVAWAALRAP